MTEDVHYIPTNDATEDAISTYIEAIDQSQEINILEEDTPVGASIDGEPS